MPANDQIRIAIIGGGLAGATLMNALLKVPHLDVHIFESAPEFSERGAAVGIAKNGQDALEQIGPDIAATLDRAGAVVMSSSRLYMASGPSSMSMIFDLAGEQRGKVVHRAAFLQELLKPIPADRMHTNKKVVMIEDAEDGGVTVKFSDDTILSFDAVVGADGVHGRVRSYVLGSDHPALKPKFGGFWDARSLIPMEKAKELLGDEYFLEGEQRQYGWVGDGGFFMHDVLDDGSTVQCVAAIRDENWGEQEWKRSLDRAQLESVLSNWIDTPIKKGIIESLLLNEELQAFAEWHHIEPTPTYSRGRVCMTGDAAHCMTPWQGAGAGSAIEDAMVLAALMQDVTASAELSIALKAYDRIRRPRAQKIIESSYGTGVLMCGRGEGVGLDIDKLRETLPPRWAFIFGQDMAEHKNESLAVMRGMRVSGAE